MQRKRLTHMYIVSPSKCHGILSRIHVLLVKALIRGIWFKILFQIERAQIEWMDGLVLPQK